MRARPKRPLGGLGDATGGAAAVEFAIVLPVLAAFVLGIIEYGGMLVAYNKMHDAIASGAVYVMRGGSSTTAIHDLTVAAWHNKPNDAAVTVTQVCTCQGIGASCTVVCAADSSYPQKYTSIAASGSYAGLWGVKAMSGVQTIRTQ